MSQGDEAVEISFRYRLIIVAHCKLNNFSDLSPTKCLGLFKDPMVALIIGQLAVIIHIIHALIMGL